MSRIIVIGAGPWGLASAVLLVRDGHDVTVLERAAPAASATTLEGKGTTPSSVARAWIYSIAAEGGTPPMDADPGTTFISCEL